MQVNRSPLSLQTAIGAYQIAEARVMTVTNALAKSDSFTSRLVASTEAPRFYKPGASNARALFAGIVAALPLEPSRQLNEAKLGVAKAKATLTDAMLTTLEQVKSVEREGGKAAAGYAETKRVAEEFLHSEDGLMFLFKPKTMPEIQTWLAYIAVADCLG